MHKLNFCGTLCLPEKIEGYKCRGIDFVKEFPEGYILPMAGAATGLHVLYTSKPIEFNLDFFKPKLRILNSTDLDTKEKVDDIGYFSVAPDHAVDPCQLADFVFKNRNNSLLDVVEKLFKQDHKKVVIWANNGIGKTVDVESSEDGILRGIEFFDIADAMRLNGKIYDQYRKGLKDSNQKSAHQHIHIAPTTTVNGFDMALLSKLNEIHGNKKEIATLNEYRRRVSALEGRYMPNIAVCVLESKNELPSELVFSFYKNIDLINPEQYEMAGLAKEVITEHSKSRGWDFENEEFKNEQIANTKRFYEEKLN